MSNDPDSGADKPTCPDCASVRITTTDPVTTLRDYRCRDCGTEFDEDGGVAVVE